LRVAAVDGSERIGEHPVAGCLQKALAEPAAVAAVQILGFGRTRARRSGIFRDAMAVGHQLLTTDIVATTLQGGLSTSGGRREYRRQ
jgi:hypothetical protein